jgi:hypothetical protein
MKFGIGSRIAALSIGLVAVTAVVAGWTSFNQGNELLADQEKEALADDAWQFDASLETYLNILEEDVQA